MKNKKYPIIHMGTVSILVVFLILCLVTFALLSYVSAKTDYGYADAAAQRNTDYYEACAEAAVQTDALEEILIHSYSDNEEEYYDTVYTALANDSSYIINDSATDVHPTVTFTLPVGDASCLEVIVQINWPNQTGDTYYQILSWKEVSTQEWTPETGMNLM